MAFWIHIEGRGEGCGHGVGCNEQLLPLRARTLKGAIAEIKEEYHSRIIETWEGAIDSLTIIEGKETAFDIEQVREEHKASQNTAEAKALLAKEKKEYERLRKKFDPVSAREVKGPHPERPAKGDSSWDGDCG